MLHIVPRGGGMTLSNLGLLLASWPCACLGFAGMTAPTQASSGNGWSSGYDGERGGESFVRAEAQLWRTGTRADERFTERHSRLPRRRRRLSTIGMRGTKRGSSGEAGAVGPGSPSPRNRSEMGPESERYKTADSTEGPQASTPAGTSKSSSSSKALMTQMVKAAGQRQHWKEAIVMFDEMQDEGIPPVKAAYAAALRACAKGAEWERSTQLLDNYLEEGYPLDEGVVKATVKACCRAGRPSEAEAVLVKSLERGLVPEVSLYTAVMNACYTVGDMDAILSLGEQLRAQSLTPDQTAYHLMVTSHISKLDWVSATEALVEMGQAGLAPTSLSARKWRLASAAIEEIDIGVDEDLNVVGDEERVSEGDAEQLEERSDRGRRWNDGGSRKSVVDEDRGDTAPDR